MAKKKENLVNDSCIYQADVTGDYQDLVIYAEILVEGEGMNADFRLVEVAGELCLVAHETEMNLSDITEHFGITLN